MTRYLVKIIDDKLNEYEETVMTNDPNMVAQIAVMGFESRNPNTENFSVVSIGFAE